MNTSMKPGQPWTDTDGNLIQAHGGGLLYHGGLYYWYGENKSMGGNNHVGISCYSSADLLNWKNEGVVLPKEALPEAYRDTGVAERPKVLYNEKTRQFVMWLHLDAEGYTHSYAGVCAAPDPAGPFAYVRHFRPVAYDYGYPAEDKAHEREKGNTYRDMTLFRDQEGYAYCIYASESNLTLYICRLTEDYLDIERPTALGKNWQRAFPGAMREAPAPFYHGGKYYIVSSYCTGWAPNQAMIGTADHMLGNWEIIGDPCLNDGKHTTFDSQSTYVQPLSGQPDRFLFMADRWLPTDLGNSPYIWLPLEMKDGQAKIAWVDEWHS